MLNIMVIIYICQILYFTLQCQNKNNTIMKENKRHRFVYLVCNTDNEVMKCFGSYTNAKAYAESCVLNCVTDFTPRVVRRILY